MFSYSEIKRSSSLFLNLIMNPNSTVVHDFGDDDVDDTWVFIFDAGNVSEVPCVSIKWLTLSELLH